MDKCNFCENGLCTLNRSPVQQVWEKHYANTPLSECDGSIDAVHKCGFGIIIDDRSVEVSTADRIFTSLRECGRFDEHGNFVISKSRFETLERCYKEESL